MSVPWLSNKYSRLYIPFYIYIGISYPKLLENLIVLYLHHIRYNTRIHLHAAQRKTDYRVYYYYLCINARLHLRPWSIFYMYRTYCDTHPTIWYLKRTNITDISRIRGNFVNILDQPDSWQFIYDKFTFLYLDKKSKKNNNKKAKNKKRRSVRSSELAGATRLPDFL